MKDIKELEGLEIFLGYSCNLKCKFCFQKDLRYKKSGFLDYDKVISIIDNGVNSGKKFIIFSGGEATIDPNILKYINYCRNNGFIDIRLHTNGITFSDKNILNSYIKAGMTGVILSIHGYGNIHDLLVGKKGGFDIIKKTLLNLSEIRKNNNIFVIDTNTVLNKFNYNSLDTLFKFLNYFPITRSQIVQLYSLYLFNRSEKEKLYVSYGEFSKYIGKIIEISKNITLENFPLCKVDKKYWDFIFKRQKYNNEAYGNILEGFEESDCTYVSSCNNCLYKKECTGIPKDYLQVFNNEKFTI